MLTEVEVIAEKAIKRNHLKKLIYIFQTIDCMLFEEKYKNYQNIFDKISDAIEKNKAYPYIKLSKYKYKDLDKIGFKKCVTFDILSYEK